MVFACVTQVLSLLFSLVLKSKESRKLKSIVPTSLVNAKRHLGSTQALHYFLTGAHDVANTPLLLPSKEHVGKRHSKQKTLDRMFFMFLLMGNYKGIGVRRASCKTIGNKFASFKSSQELFDAPQVVPQDLTAEMLPPWDNVPKTWSQRLQDGEELMKFDPDNVMPTPESVNPSVSIANPSTSNWLLQTRPSLPNFQVPKLAAIDQDTGGAIVCMAGQQARVQTQRSLHLMRVASQWGLIIDLQHACLRTSRTLQGNSPSPGNSSRLLEEPRRSTCTLGPLSGCLKMIKG